MTIRGIRLGCPVWTSRDWVGLLFTRRARGPEYLTEYASVFNAVEGNTTFYGVPTAGTVDGWRDRTPPGFRFCFKFPRAVSHDCDLDDSGPQADAFLAAMAPLAERLGPFFLQLPPSVGPEALPKIDRFLSRLPDSVRCAVEVRSPAFFASETERELDAVLAAREVDRVLYDPRGLRAADPREPGVADAQRRLARVPVRFTATAKRPFVRLMSHPEPMANRQLFGQWCAVLADWIAEGRMPHVFVHTVDDRLSPLLARELHRLLSRRIDVGEVPMFPAEAEEPPPQQLSFLG